MGGQLEHCPLRHVSGRPFLTFGELYQILYSIIQETDSKAQALLQYLCDLCVGGGGAQERLSVCQEPAGGHSVHIHSAIKVYVEHQTITGDGPRA